MLYNSAYEERAPIFSDCMVLHLGSVLTPYFLSTQIYRIAITVVILHIHTRNYFGLFKFLGNERFKNEVLLSFDPASLVYRGYSIRPHDDNPTLVQYISTGHTSHFGFLGMQIVCPWATKTRFTIE